MHWKHACFLVSKRIIYIKKWKSLQEQVLKAYDKPNETSLLSLSNLQGFCCSCSLADQLGLSHTSTIRSETNCALFGSGQVRSKAMCEANATWSSSNKIERYYIYQYSLSFSLSFSFSLTHHSLTHSLLLTLSPIPLDFQASAHCLRMDPLWYDAYSIGPAQIDFTISIIVYRHTSTSSSSPYAPDPSCTALGTAPAGVWA